MLFLRNCYTLQREKRKMIKNNSKNNSKILMNSMTSKKLPTIIGVGHR